MTLVASRPGTGFVRTIAALVRAPRLRAFVRGAMLALAAPVLLAAAAAQAAPLAASPGTLSFDAAAGGADPAPATLSVSGKRNLKIGFSATSDKAWLTATPSKGTTPTTVQVKVSAAGLAAGTYTANLMLSPIPAGGATSVLVQFTVRPGGGGVALSGNLSPASLGAGTLVTLSGAANRSTTADGAGNYTFTGLAKGNYTVTPTRSGVTFTPSSRNVAIQNTNVGGINFTAAGGGTTVFFDDFTGNTLGSAWSVIQRRGPAAQDENECNTADAVSVSGGSLNIKTSATPATCGDAVTEPSLLPYTSGDVQWTSLNFTYGTVEVRAKFPPQDTSTWPAIWLLGSNCQKANLVNGSEYEPFMGCPSQGSAGYREIDVVECDKRGWCHVVVAQGISGWSDLCSFPINDDWHVFKLNWTAARTTLVVDDNPTGCSFANTALNGPMFLIMQTQTTTARGVAGLPNNSKLPTTFQIDYVKVTQP